MFCIAASTSARGFNFDATDYRVLLRARQLRTEKRRPEDDRSGRRQWEYSHATSAGLNLVALLATIVAVLRGTRPPAR